jgi:hypothetical protein
MNRRRLVARDVMHLSLNADRQAGFFVVDRAVDRDCVLVHVAPIISRATLLVLKYIVPYLAVAWQVFICPRLRYTTRRMYHRKSKRQTRAQLAFVYTLMAISVVSVVAVLALVILGYRFNRYDGRVEQGGLVQFDSRPTGATVTIDGITLTNKTTSKITATSGPHTIAMTKPGYVRWEKDITVQPGGVLWLNYALLMPAQPTTRVIATLPTVSSSLVSLDRKHIVMVGAQHEPMLYAVALNDDNPTVAKVAVAATALTGPDEATTQSFTLVAVDKEGRDALVRHRYGDKVEYLAVDLRSGTTYNITQSLGVDIIDLDYRLGDTGTVYVLTAAHELRRVVIAADTISGPLVSNVSDFTQADQSTLTYVTLPDVNGIRSAGYLTNGANRPRVIGTTNRADTYQLVMGKYFSERYVTILEGTKLTIRKGNLPASDSDDRASLTMAAQFEVVSGATSVQYAPEDNRFVLVQSGSSVVSYDLELMQRATVTLPASPARPATWIDNYHWATTVSGTVMYYDFDGTNGQMVASGVTDQAVTLAENSKYFYYIVPSPTGSQLVRAQMTA